MVRRVVFQPLLLQDGKQPSKPVLLLRGQRFALRGDARAFCPQRESCLTSGCRLFDFKWILLSAHKKTPGKHFCLPGETA